MNPAYAPLSKLSPEVVVMLARKHVLRYELMRERAIRQRTLTGSASPYRPDEIAHYLATWEAVLLAGGHLDRVLEPLRAAAVAEVYDAADDEGLLFDDEEEQS